MASEVVGLFATPLSRVRNVLAAPLLDALTAHFTSSAKKPNSSSERLTHTELLAPEKQPLMQQACQLIAPHVVDFGELLLGERQSWSIKEAWVNVLETGGRQALHNHANSFISGILYLTASHASANTVFVKAPGGSDFVLNNTNARAKLGPYNADKWVAPDPAPGDMLLFPSYLLHEVGTNDGPRRSTLAFNAIPHKIDSWGYTLTLSR